MKSILPKKKGEQPQPSRDLNLDMFRTPGTKEKPVPHQIRDAKAKEAGR